MSAMDMLRSIVPARKAKLGGRCSYALTELGKTKAEEFGASGDMWQVLAYLDENGASTLREICDGTHLGEEKVKAILKRAIEAYRYVITRD